LVEGIGLVDGVVPFNRPPRLTPAVESAALCVPGAPPDRPESEPLSIAGIVLPIVGGAVIALLLSPMLAVFAALGPVITIGMWWERRHRADRGHREATEREREAGAALEARLPLLCAAETTRRRDLVPTVDVVVERAMRLSSRIWERGTDDLDAFLTGIGTTEDRFAPTLHVEGDGSDPVPSSLAMEAINSAAPLAGVPLVIDLAPGRTVGIVGPRSAAQRVGRALVAQLVVHHGPSVARVAVAASASTVADWAWCRWLPHCSDPDDGESGALLGVTSDTAIADRAFTGLSSESTTTVIGILDDPGAFQGRDTVGRRLVAHERVALIVIAPSVDRLPVGCTDLLRIDPAGRITRRDPRSGERATSGTAWGLSISQATAAARRLAQLDDPALRRRDVGVPDTVPLLRTLDVNGDDPVEILDRWGRTRGADALTATMGADAHGAVEFDLIADGPHLLVGGTTGSGKSELLRSLIAGLAASHDPDHCAFVLIDYKGGAAFDCCRELPHVAGFVTDLDQSLAARALQCLEAELRYREDRLRAVGAQDMAAFRALAPPGPALPRMVVVVDEFATLASELPEFLDALVGIAQRGRSLGVHLVLATQRPAGVVTDDIRANAGCRIALRVTDSHDSVDVIGTPDAAAIPRSRPGRAIARLGPSELIAFQSAIVTGQKARRDPIEIRIVGDRGSGVGELADDGQSDLQRLVHTVGLAWGDRSLPRSPWPDPLPSTAERNADGWWLVDDPEAQCRRVEGWTPADGHLVVVGGPGSGVTSTLAEAAFSGIERDGHVYVIDLDAGGLGALDSLESVGVVVGPTDAERRRRLLRRLDGEVADRRAAAGRGDVPILLIIDDLGGLERAHEPIRESEIHDQLARIWADGPAVSVVVATSLRRPAELPTAMAATAGTVLLHTTTDRADALRFGLPAIDTVLPPGRARRASDGALVHVMRSGRDLGEAASAWASRCPSRPPFVIGILERSIGAVEGGASVTVDATAELCVAIAEFDLGPTSLALHPGEHALVLGPARSGRTTALVTIGRLARSVVVVGAGSAVAAALDTEPIEPSALAAALAQRGPTLVLIDDCLNVEDPTGDLARLIRRPPEGVHLVASAHPGRLRQAYGHWAADLAASRTGVLLQPDPLDGDLLGAPLPGRLRRIDVPGRGFLVADGHARLVQLVHHI
jgi:S-DNA-T family DNA segregation ATPase FtsK/SpoIIIE